MFKQEEIKPYSNQGEKEPQVEAMFDNIAPTYDRLNHSMAWSIDRWWRRRALKTYSRYVSHPFLLDIATGTGDLAIDAIQLLSPSHIDATDISEGMMAIGKTKVADYGYKDSITFRHDDVMNLSAEDNSYDGIISAYGLRNFPDLKKSLSEMYRVTKDGCSICLIELAVPNWPVIKQLFWLYSHTLMPLIGWILSRDIKAYRYLVKTIEAFPQAEQIDLLLLNTGFRTAEHHRMTFGICTYFIARK